MAKVKRKIKKRKRGCESKKQTQPQVNKDRTITLDKKILANYLCSTTLKGGIRNGKSKSSN